MIRIDYIPDYRRGRNGMTNYVRISIFNGPRRTGTIYCECSEVEYFKNKYPRKG